MDDGKVRLACGAEVDYDSIYGRGSGVHCEVCREARLRKASEDRRKRDPSLLQPPREGQPPLEKVNRNIVDGMLGDGTHEECYDKNGGIIHPPECVCEICQRRRRAKTRIAREAAKDGSIEGLPFLASRIPPGRVRGATAMPAPASDLGVKREAKCKKCGDTGQVLIMRKHVMVNDPLNPGGDVMGPCDECPKDDVVLEEPVCGMCALGVPITTWPGYPEREEHLVDIGSSGRASVICIESEWFRNAWDRS